jgi:hypothetical protein
MGLLTLSLCVLPFLCSISPACAQVGEEFMVGINYPWIAYGHDFGGNAWGHDGLTTNGWTYQTYTDSQGFTDTRVCSEKACSGEASLCITADLQGQDQHKANGEVYVDLRNHPPPGITAPINLEGVTVHCKLWLPKGSAGYSHAPNGVQLFFKSEGWLSWYSEWINIQPAWEGVCHTITVNLSDQPGRKDLQFDPTKVIAVGVKVAINSSSDAKLQGTIYLDDYILETDPPITFDFEQLEVERDFAALHEVLSECSTAVVRVFIFADGRASPEFAENGEVEGFDEYFFEDFDALVKAAQEYDIMLIPVLLDYLWFNSPEFVNGAQLGGHSDIIRDPAKRQTFIDNALRPLVERYCDNSQIIAWDVINEPEWAIEELGNVLVGDPVKLKEMQNFVQLCAETIHECASQKVTLGSARLMWLDYWKGLGLDFYQFHWYDKYEEEEPFPWPLYSQLGLDKPCIIGEVPTDNTQYSTGRYLKAACRRGYQGLLVWSYRGSDEYSDFSQAEPYLERWRARALCR